MRKKTQISERKVQMTKSKARKNAKGQKYEKGSKSWKHKTEALVVFFYNGAEKKITKQSSKEPRIGEKKTQAEGSAISWRTKSYDQDYAVHQHQGFQSGFVVNRQTKFFPKKQRSEITLKLLLWVQRSRVLMSFEV